MNLLDYAYLCSSSYSGHDILDTTGLDSSKLKFGTFRPYNNYENEDIYFYSIESALNSTLYVVIEGTNSIGNLVDGLYIPVQYSLPNGDHDGVIHSAWLSMAKKIKELLDPVVLNSDKYASIIFVGHSMGAAIAMILLLEYAAAHTDALQFKSYAIALPQFCNNVVATYLDNNADFVVINNGNDPITKLHMCMSDCTYITKNIILLTPDQLSLNIAHHLMNSYIKNIELLYKNCKLLAQVD
jgi:predicted esterase